MTDRAVVFGNDVNTGYIIPAQYANASAEEMAEHVFDPLDQHVGSGDIVIAGNNFGTGSSREAAARAPLAAGIETIVAESFARIYFRNCIAVGLTPIVCPDVTDHVNTGDAISIDLNSGVVRNETTDVELSCDIPPEDLRRISDAGGLIPYYQQQESGLD